MFILCSCLAVWWNLTYLNIFELSIFWPKEMRVFLNHWVLHYLVGCFHLVSITVVNHWAVTFFPAYVSSYMGTHVIVSAGIILTVHLYQIIINFTHHFWEGLFFLKYFVPPKFCYFGKPLLWEFYSITCTKF